MKHFLSFLDVTICLMGLGLGSPSSRTYSGWLHSCGSRKHVRAKIYFIEMGRNAHRIQRFVYCRRNYSASFGANYCTFTLVRKLSQEQAHGFQQNVDLEIEGDDVVTLSPDAVQAQLLSKLGLSVRPVKRYENPS